jgi:hypothetical protein
MILLPVVGRSSSLVRGRSSRPAGMRSSPSSGRLDPASEQPSISTWRSPGATTSPLQAGIGLDVGEAVPVGDGFRGRAINMAARLCARAKPGETLITPELAHLAGSIEGIVLEDGGPVRLKGFSRLAACGRRRDGRSTGRLGAASVGRHRSTTSRADGHPSRVGCLRGHCSSGGSNRFHRRSRRRSPRPGWVGPASAR